MNRISRKLVAAVGVIVPLAAGVAQAADPTPPERLHAIQSAKVAFTDALERAQGQAPDAIPIRVELTLLDARPVYEVAFLLGDPIHVMVVDAATGEMVARFDRGRWRDHTIIRERNKEPHVGLLQALDIASAEFKDFKPFKAEAAVKGNEMFFEVFLVSDEGVVLRVRLTMRGEVIEAGPPPAPHGKPKR